MAWSSSQAMQVRLSTPCCVWSSDLRTVKEMGMRARKMLDEHFTRQKAFERWAGLLDQLNNFASLKTRAHEM